MERNVIGLPAGFRDLLFEEADRRRGIENGFASVFAKAGYREIVPSGVEFVEVYGRGKQGIKDRTFKFLDRDDNLLALRADFTAAVARIVGGRFRDADLPVRLWYSGAVFRKADRHRGQFHEFSQIGGEVIGLSDVSHDAEVLDVALSCLVSAGVGDACVHVNHAGVFRGIVESLGLDVRAEEKLRAAIDRKDMRALGIRLDQLGAGTAIRDQVGVLSRCVGDETVMGRAAAAVTNDRSRAALDVLSRLSKLLPSWTGRIVYDLTEIDELEYYTGTMFTFFSPSHSGELGKGGRYDSLLKEFGADLPAVGFSLSLDRISECL